MAVIGRKVKMTQKTKEMSPSEVLERIRKLQEKESDTYNQINEVNEFFQVFLKELEEKFKEVATLNFFEIAEYSNLKERLHELEEAGALSDSEIKEYRELILAAEKNQTEAQKRCEDLGMIAKKITHMSVKLKNEILFAQKNQ